MQKPNIVGFNGIVELENSVRNLDRAIRFPVYYKKQLGDETAVFEEAKENCAIYNIDKKRLAKIFTDKYSLLEHNEAFGYITDTLRHLNITNVSGFVKSWNGDVVQLLVKFDDIKIADDSEQGLNLGFMISNSYNGWSAFKGSAWAYRSICANGMIIGSVITDCKFWEMHYGKPKETFLKELEIFINNLITNCGELQNYVNEAIKDTVEWNLAKNILKAILEVEKHRIMLSNRLRYIYDEKGSINRWDLFNLVTELASNGESISYGYEQYLQKRAEQILTCTIPEMKINK